MGKSGGGRARRGRAGGRRRAAARADRRWRAVCADLLAWEAGFSGGVLRREEGLDADSVILFCGSLLKKDGPGD